MKIHLDWNNDKYVVNLKEGKDISIGISEDSPRSWHVDRPRLSPVVMGDFIGSVEKGAPVNFYEVHFNPHGHGTHTECRGHIDKRFQKIQDANKETHCIAQLITVTPAQVKEDLIILEQDVKALCREEQCEALIIRTSPNSEGKRKKVWTSTNPPFLETKAMEWIAAQGIRHLIIDTPSVDKEKDEGRLENHNAFWADESRNDATITELVYVPSTIVDGIYFLNLQRANFDLDCAPSRPIIYSMIKQP